MKKCPFSIDTGSQLNFFIVSFAEHKIIIVVDGKLKKRRPLCRT